MSNLGDQTPPKGPDKNPPDLDIDQTLPEGAFDKTLPEGWTDPVPNGEAATLVGDEPARVDDGATMIGDESAPIDDAATMVIDESAPIDDGATIVGFDANAAGQGSGDVDPDKTLPEGVLAVLADEDYSMKTIMMDDIVTGAENAPPEEDFGKTLPDGAFDQMGGDDFAEKTMMLDSSGAGAEGEQFDDANKTLPEGAFNSPDAGGATMLEDGSGVADQDDGFGKTVQADAFGKTIATDGTIAQEPDFDGKTIVGPDSAVEGEIHVNIKTVSDPKLKRSGESVVKTRATHTGGKTSIDGTDVVGSETIDGIDKDSLNVAMRSISGLQFGANPRVDFKLVKQLGEGGMGVVYVARQQSLGREVVFKTLKPMAETQASKLKASGTMNSVIKHRTDMFLSEAVVTADLFHPNIVPIYELAKAPDGSLFYTMKWVRGDGWNKRLKEMTLEENLEVLMKVSDAMGFAHSRHIVNRDLKPENVMLGGYGETIVLDWGLALPFGEGKGRLPIATTAGLGSGTPAYMPPELITGPLAKIGPACDIYLLGAMLFEVVTGVPPHDFSSRQSGGTMSAGARLAEVRRVVVDNIIRETEHTGELMDIARKAMETKPEDRYRSVAEFQNAIRDYMKHAASHTLADRARELTTVAAPIATEGKPAADSPTVSYSNYQNALALYNESLREWTGNNEARIGLSETQLNFAKLALVKGDYDLGLSVLDTNADSHSETRSKLLLARQEREGRVRLMKMLKVAAGILVAAVMVLLVVAAKFQLDFREARKLKELALEDTKNAKLDREQALKDQKQAEEQKVEADKKAEQARKDSLAANIEKEKAEKASELARMASELAMKETEEANKKTALALVAKAEAEAASTKADKAKIEAEKATDLANKEKARAEAEGRKALYKKQLADASRVFFEGNYPETLKKLDQLKKKYSDLCDREWELLNKAASAPDAVSLSKPVESISLSRDGRKLVTGDSSGQVVVWPIDADGKIDEDNPIRRLQLGQLGTRLHVVAISPAGNEIAAAGDDGDISVWSLTAAAEQPPRVLKGHEKSVKALKFSDDGQRLVSGGDDRTIRLWSVAEKQTLVQDRVLYAVQCIDWSRDGLWLVAGTSAPEDVSGVAYSWKVQSSKDQLKLIPVRQFQVLPKSKEKVKQNRGVIAIALTDDGKFAISNGPAAELHLWQVNPAVKDSQANSLKINLDPTTMKKLGEHSNRVERVRSVAISADSSRLLVAGDDGKISIWDRQEFDSDKMPVYTRRKKLIDGHGGPVRGCFPLPQSPDLIISGSYDQNVHRLDLKKYFQTREDYDAFEDTAPPAAFRPAESDVSVLDQLHQSDSASCGADVPAEAAHSEYALASFPLSEQDQPEKAAVPQEPAPPKGEPRKSVLIAAGINDKNEIVGHTDSVLSAVFSRDGKRVLSASRDQTARAWDSETGKPINTVTGRAAIFDGNVFKEGHEYDLFVMRFFPDGTKLLTSGFDGEMRIWDSRIDGDKSFGRELAVLPYTSMYGVVDISRDGQWILTAGRGSTPRRKFAAGRVEEDDEEEREEKKYGAQAQLWNTETVLANRRPTPKFKLDNVHRFRVTTVAISPDNNRLLTGDREGKVVLWDANTGKVVGQPRVLHTGEVVKSEFLGEDGSRGSRLLTAGVDRRVMLWKVVKSDTEFELKKIREFDQEGMVVNLAVNPRQDRFISVVRLGDKTTKAADFKGANTKVSLWNIDSDEKPKVIDIPSRNTLRDTTMTEKDRDRERERDRPPYPAWAIDSNQAIITTSEGITTAEGLTASEGTIHFYDSVADKITRSLRVDNRNGTDRRAEPYATILRPDEPEPLHLLTQTHTAAFLWRLKKDGTGENLVSFRPQGPVFSAGYSSDGRFVVTGGRSIRIFDADESKITYGRLLHKFEYPHEGVVTSVEFSPAKNSYRFLTTSYDETAKIWEWHPDRKVVESVCSLIDDPKNSVQTNPVRFGTWSADGLRVLTVGDDARARVWSFPPNQEPKSITLEFPENLAQEKPKEPTHNFDQLCGAFSWDGQFVAVGGRDADTDESIGWIWNLELTEGGKPVLYAQIKGHGLGGINSVAFLPDDNRLLTGGTDGTARLWDWQKSAAAAADGKVIVDADFLISLVRPNKQTTTHRGAVTSVRVTRSGDIVTASSDGTVLIWPK